MAILGGGNETVVLERAWTISTTLVPHYRVKAIVHCFGGGGSGGQGQNTGSTIAVGCGGGAGEHSASVLILDPAVTYTITVGAGGPGNNMGGDSVGLAVTGTAGGTTSFSGSGITTITANGGGGGVGAAVGSTNSTWAGGAGGTGGAGGLYTYDGGRGGSATATFSEGGVAMGGGGGSVGIYSDGFRAGDMLSQHTVRITSGAGIGGVSADVDGATQSSNDHHLTSGPGTVMGPGVAAGGNGIAGLIQTPGLDIHARNDMDIGSDITAPVNGTRVTLLDFTALATGDNEFFAGTAAISSRIFDAIQHSNTAGGMPGNGGYAERCAGSGGIFAGGGGAGDQTYQVQSGAGGAFGGGGGGAAGGHSAKTTTMAGGVGGVIIQYLEIQR